MVRKSERRQQSLHKSILEALVVNSPQVEVLLAAVWRKKLRAAGFRITAKRRAYLDQVASAVVERREIPPPIKSRRHIEIAVDESDVEAAMQLALDAMTAAVETGLKAAGKSAARQVLRVAPIVGAQTMAENADFQRRLLKVWGPAFRWMHALLNASIEIGEMATVDGAGLRRRRYVHKALVQIHARGCLAAGEVLALLEAGFASGALGRWRTLHELETVGEFIKTNGNAMARRYLAHAVVENVKIARAAELDPATFDLAGLVGQRKARRLRQRSRESMDDLGWVGKMPGSGRPTFVAIEKATERASWRQAYLLACGAVHTGAHSTRQPLGLPEGAHFFLAGPSNEGIELPANWTVQRLAMLTMLMTDFLPASDGAVLASSFKELAARTMREVEQGQVRYERAYARHLAKHAAVESRRERRGLVSPQQP
jgi:hypothetical protein